MNNTIKKKIATWIDSHSPTCPVCQGTDWNNPPDFVRLMTGDGKSEGPVIELLKIMFICNSCGYAFLVSSAAMGIKLPGGYG